jgi:DivIVA domain-containing protein
VGVIVAVVIGIAVLAGIAVMLAVTERSISDEPVDRLDPGLPDGPITAADIPGLRFRIGLRGYRMDDVDAALARIHDSLAEAEGTDSGEPADGER